MVVATPPPPSFGFSLVPFLHFLLRLSYGQFTHPLFYTHVSMKNVFKCHEKSWGGGVCSNPPRPEREGVAAKINTFS